MKTKKKKSSLIEEIDSDDDDFDSCELVLVDFEPDQYEKPKISKSFIFSIAFVFLFSVFLLLLMPRKDALLFSFRLNTPKKTFKTHNNFRKKTKNYSPLYVPLYEKLNEKEMKYDSECMQFIDGEIKDLNDKNCYTHTQYEHLLCCHLGVLPSESNNSHILVLGSAGRVGQELVEILQSKGEKFIEVRGKLHFDLRDDSVYRMFNTVNISVVYDLINSEQATHTKIQEYFAKKDVTVIRLVDQFVESKPNLLQVQLPAQPFGIQYIRPSTSDFYKSIFKCLIKNNCSNDDDTNHQKTKYILANQIATYLYSIISNKQGTLSPTFKLYSGSEIWNSLATYQISPKKQKDPLMSVFDTIISKYNETQSNPYTTLVFLTTNDDIHIQRAQNTLNVIENILEIYPDISIELIQFYLQTNQNSSFIEKMSVGPEISKRMHVIEFSKPEFLKLNNVFNTTEDMIPEYFFRNIGVRLGQGDILMTGSEDVIPAPPFFEIVQRKLVSPMISWRSIRKNRNNIQNVISEYMQEYTRASTYLDSYTRRTFDNHFRFSNGPTGDLQGAPRQQLYKLNGWPWGSYVYYSDTAFHMDQTTFKVPHYEIKLYSSINQHHRELFFNSPYFKMDN